MAMRQVTQEMMWIRNLHKDLFQDENLKAFIVNVDNQGAIHMVSNTAFRTQSKHIDIE